MSWARAKRRVGLVGAGGICRHHVAALRRLESVELVGLTDIDGERAASLGRELSVEPLPSLAELVERGAEVIHVLTPPRSHAAVALEAIERGCHVLCEKPLCDDVADCLRLREAAASAGRVLGVDHSLLFDPLVVHALDAVRAGKLGRVVALDILRGSVYPPYTTADPPPWVRQAGYPFRDLGIHALYLCQAFLGPIRDVDARWRSFGGDPNLTFDEWRAVVSCRDGIGQLQLSWNQRPIQHQLIVHGTRGVLRLDLFALFRSLRRPYPLPGAAERLLGGVSDALEPLWHMSRSVVRVASGAIVPYQGLHQLVAAFYRHLDGDGPAPVDLDQATEAVRWCEAVARAAERDVTRRLGSTSQSPRGVRYLVTGASGALGSAIVERLRARGDRVRGLWRRAPEQVPDGLEIALGNLGDPEAVRRAVDGADVVIHAGAAMRGGWAEQRVATVEGTRHVLEACLESRVQKLVHVSSLSVLHHLAGQADDVVSESTALEPRPEARGAYTRAKLEAERLVHQYVGEHGLPAVVLRPGQIFGERLPLITPAVARRLPGGAWLVLGDGGVRLPLIYLDDVVDAVLLAADGELSGGEVVQLTDLSLTQNEVLAQALEGERVVRLPAPLLFAAARLGEALSSAFGRSWPLPVYRLRSALARRRYQSHHAGLLGWQPRIGVQHGIERWLATEGTG